MTDWLCKAQPGRALARMDCGGISWLLLGECLHHRFCLGPLGTLGCWAWGPAGHSQGWQILGSRLQPSTGMTGWAHAGDLHSRLRCSAHRGAAFCWHQAELSPKAEHPQPQWGWGRGDMGICSCLSLSSHPRRIFSEEEEGFFGTICWLCLCLPGAGTMCPAPSSATVAGSGHAHAMQM